MPDSTHPTPADNPNLKARSYKVGVKTPGDTDWVYNALRFNSRDAAERYGRDLFMRWTAVKEWAVHPCDEPPNR